jgi:hypothetical protein
VADTLWDNGRVLLISERVNIILARNRPKIEPEKMPVWILE